MTPELIKKHAEVPDERIYIVPEGATKKQVIVVPTEVYDTLSKHKKERLRAILLDALAPVKSYEFTKEEKIFCLLSGLRKADYARGINSAHGDIEDMILFLEGKLKKLKIYFTELDYDQKIMGVEYFDYYLYNKTKLMDELKCSKARKEAITQEQKRIRKMTVGEITDRAFVTKEISFENLQTFIKGLNEILGKRKTRQNANAQAFVDVMNEGGLM